MPYSTTIREKLAQAEATFRELGASAFRDGDDGGSELARHIVSMLKRLREETAEHPYDSVPTETKSQKAKNSASKKTSARRKRSSKSNTEYPRYEIRNATLVRIGWSKKKNAEYEHKTSKNTYTQVVQAIDSLSSYTAAPYTAEMLLEHMAELKYHIPSYQVYIVLGVLRDKGCLDQIAKGEYSLASDFARQAEELWQSLAGG